MKRTLGTTLRHLIELLDGGVEQVYVDFDLDYKPRFTPIVRTLSKNGTGTISELAKEAGITQPAATQTVQAMLKKGLVVVSVSERDSRQKVVTLSNKGKAMISQLEQCWQATAMAAESLDNELQTSLSTLAEEAIVALEKKPFKARIKNAHNQLKSTGKTI